MKIGSIVKRIDGSPLRSGAEMYGAAIVVSLEPFVLVSKDADMRWSATIEQSEFKETGEVDYSLLTVAMTRLKG